MLNILPNGKPSAKYECTASNDYEETRTVVLTEWWYDGKKVESIEKSADSYFYEYFDKAPFKIESIKLLP